jgi:hypothetical protein
MPALPTAKWRLLRSLGVTRDGRAVEGLLASGEALTRRGLLGAISFRRPGVLCLRVSTEGENPPFRRSFRDFRRVKGDRERRREDCCYQPRVITGLARALGPSWAEATSACQCAEGTAAQKNGFVCSRSDEV